MVLYAWEKTVRAQIVAACFVLGLVVSATIVASPSVVSSSRSPEVAAIEAREATDPIFASSMAVLTKQGIPTERAAEQLALQAAVGEAELIQKLEAAIGHEYASVWYEPASALLHVGVTSPKARHLAEAAAVKEGLRDSVVTTSVDSTWAELSAAQEQWDRRLLPIFELEEARTALDAERNALVVSVGTSIPAAEREALEREASNSDVKVMVEVLPASELGLQGEAVTECKKFAEDEAFCNSPLTAGVRIQSENNWICTAGPLAIPTAAKSETYVLTAGHCIKNAGVTKAWNAFWEKEKPKKIGTPPGFTFGEKGDFARIQIEKGSYWLTTEEKKPAYAVTARWSKEEKKSYPIAGEQPPAEKATTCHEGQTTGEKCGTIEKTSVNEVIDGVKVNGLVLHNANSAVGDSGGPYFGLNAKGEIMIEGTHVAQGNYQPIATSLKEMGLELLTVNNETRP